VGGPGIASGATFTAACSGMTGDSSSLIAAVASANSAGGVNIVQLGQGCMYTLTTVNNDWYGPNGLPPITSSITIEGNGSTIERSAAAGTPTFRLLYVAADPTNPNTFNYIVPAGSSSGGGQLTLQKLTLSGGFAKGGDSNGGGGGGGFGGAIFSQGIAAIEDSTLTGNIAEGGSAVDGLAGPSGGGIGSSSTFSTAGGFGSGTFGGPLGGSGSGGGGGGAGFASGENGTPTSNASGASGGGVATGLGGAGAAGSGGSAGTAGDGSGGGGASSTGAVFGGGTGGAFGAGAQAALGTHEAGGGGVGGGGGARSGTGLGAGGGGFGGGGGGPVTGASMINGGKGGFGGGGGAASSNGGTGGPSGFGGGTGTTAGGGGGGGIGGAIFNMQGTLTIRNSTIVSNQALGGADAVTDHGKGYGGAIFNLSGSVTAVSSTIADNTALNGGSGIYSVAYDAATARSALLALEDTIVAGDSGPDDVFVETPSYITPANMSTSSADLSQFDLVRTSGSFQATVTGSPLTSDPLLGPLQDNGGPTDTLEPAPNSPAIDAGKASSLTTDQRGERRPFDFSGVTNAAGGDGSDIGAYEWHGCADQATPLQSCQPVTISLAGTGTGSVTDGGAISCPTSCTGSYVQGSTATLTATPAPGSVFIGWSGDCQGSGACDVAVNAATAITATFTQIPPAAAIVATNAAGTTINPGAMLPTVAGPVLSELALKPERFRAATRAKRTPTGRNQPSIGTTITYRDTTAAKTTFTIELKAIGVRSGKRCVEPPGHIRQGARRCSLTIKRGSFSHIDKPGLNTMRFTGQIGGKPLAPATYSLIVVATNATGSSRRIGVRFQILSR
jgi:hypothetical protein